MGFSGIGLVIGLFIGIWLARKTGMTPNVKAYKDALEANAENLRVTKSRYNMRLREVEQPLALRQLVNDKNGASQIDLATAFSQILPSLPVPRFLRPFMPQILSGVQGWVTEHPDQVQAILQKVTQQGPGEQSTESGGTL